MNFNQLKVTLKGLFSAMALSAIIIACNDDKSANNSTSENGDRPLDSAAKSTTPVDNTVAAKKKTGKASTTMTADDQTVKMEKDKNGYYNRTEVSPTYTGGQSALEDYINSNIEYPQDAIDNNVEGVVNVQFAVDEKGNVSNVSTVGPKLGYGLEEASIKVVSKMSQWAPGKVKGQNVKTWRTLPINYRLES